MASQIAWLLFTVCCGISSVISVGVTELWLLILKSEDSEQIDGWPLHLQGLNAQERVAENNPSTEPNAASGSFMRDPISPSSDSSSDLDTRSSDSSFFYEKSITLGNLIGIPFDVGVSTRASNDEENPAKKRHKRHCRSKSWWGLCGSSRGQQESDMPPSLGQFLEIERRATRHKMFFNFIYDDFNSGIRTFDTNPLFAHSMDHYASQADNAQSSCALANLFRDSSLRNNSSANHHDHHHHHHRRNHSLGSRVPQFFAGICGRTRIED